MKNIKLTDRQAGLIAWALYAGLDQYQKFLMHDEWDSFMPYQQKVATRRIEKNLKKAIKLFSAKCEVSK